MYTATGTILCGVCDNINILIHNKHNLHYLHFSANIYCNLKKASTTTTLKSAQMTNKITKTILCTAILLNAIAEQSSAFTSIIQMQQPRSQASIQQKGTSSSPPPSELTLNNGRAHHWSKHEFKMADDTDTIDTLSTNEPSSSKVIPPSKFQSILKEVGLDGQLSTLSDLTNEQVVSKNGVFCNRELQFKGIRAIGFDMDYTIAQYKQPAFDKLAFDGAKVRFMTT